MQLASGAFAVSIDDVHIEHVSDGDRIVFSMDDPIRLNYEMKTSDAEENEDLILMHLPTGVEWNASSKGQGTGLVKEYVFEDRDGGGGGNLWLRLNQRIKVKRDGSNTKGYFLDIAPVNNSKNPFNSNSTSSEREDRPLQVKNIRVGMKDDLTRIVLDLTAPTQFTIEQSMAGDKLTIKGQEPVEWKGPKQSFHSEGVVQNFKVMGNGSDAYLEVQTESGAAVQRSVVEDPNSNTPKYVIDLLPNNLTATSISKLFSNSANLDPSSNMALGTGVSLQPVTSVSFDMKNEDTVVNISMPKAIDIPVIDNIYTHQVIISLPKVDWTKVSVPLGVTGLIKEYKVDQSLPDRTNLILSIDKAAGVIGRRLSAGGVQQGGNFTVILSTDNAKVPAWLSEVTVENLPYTAQEKKERVLATRALKYRGGVLEYANIGEGFYLTGLGGQVAGLNATSTNSSNNTGDFSSALLGGGGYAGVGYGIQIERGYFGLEGFLGYQGLSNKIEWTNPSVSRSRTLIGLSWVIAGRAGYYMSPVSLLYGKAGVASTTITIDGTGNGNLLYNSKKIAPRSGFLFGAGIEAVVDDQLSARIETYQTTYQPIKALASTGMTAKFHPRIQEMLVGVSWKPSPMGGPAATEAYEDSTTSGIYMGGEAGLGSAVNNREVIGTPPNKYKASTIVIEPLWGMYGGYSYNMGRYYVAGESQIAFNQSKFNESRTSSTNQTESFENFLRWSFALTGRFGYIFNHGVIGYGRVGVVASRFSHDGIKASGQQSILTAQKRLSRTVTGLRVGGGLEIFFQPSLSLRGDYNMDLYPAVSIKSTNGSSEKVLATRNEFKLGLAYTLPVK